MHEFELCVGDGTRSFADTETEKKKPDIENNIPRIIWRGKVGLKEVCRFH